MTPGIYAYLAALALAAASLARIGFLLGWRRPVAAQTVGTDLGEGERQHDRDMHLAALFDGKPTWDDNHWKRVAARVAYRVDGRDYRADVTLYPHRGDTAETAPVVWYDPADPSRVTAGGPARAALGLLIAGALAIAGFYLA